MRPVERRSSRRSSFRRSRVQLDQFGRRRHRVRRLHRVKSRPVKPPGVLHGVVDLGVEEFGQGRQDPRIRPRLLFQPVHGDQFPRRRFSPREDGGRLPPPRYTRLATHVTRCHHRSWLLVWTVRPQWISVAPPTSQELFCCSCCCHGWCSREESSRPPGKLMLRQAIFVQYFTALRIP